MRPHQHVHLHLCQHWYLHLSLHLSALILISIFLCIDICIYVAPKFPSTCSLMYINLCFCTIVCICIWACISKGKVGKSCMWDYIGICATTTSVSVSQYFHLHRGQHRHLLSVLIKEGIPTRQ